MNLPTIKKGIPIPILKDDGRRTRNKPVRKKKGPKWKPFLMSLEKGDSFKISCPAFQTICATARTMGIDLEWERVGRGCDGMAMYRVWLRGMIPVEGESWTTESPTEPGDYWFYGDPHMGSMGGHFFEGDRTILPHHKMYFVEVRKISNGMMATTHGFFMNMNPWDDKARKDRREGYVGYWKNADTPEPPEDVMGFFGKEKE